MWQRRWRVFRVACGVNCFIAANLSWFIGYIGWSVPMQHNLPTLKVTDSMKTRTFTSASQLPYLYSIGAKYYTKRTHGSTSRDTCL